MIRNDFKKGYKGGFGKAKQFKHSSCALIISATAKRPDNTGFNSLKLGIISVAKPCQKAADFKPVLVVVKQGDIENRKNRN